jgi:hypothetical protein
MRARSFFRWTAVALLVLATTGGISEQTYDCEEAHAHLKSCCPGFHTDVDYCDSGCGSSPQLAVDQAKCILATSCADLQSKGICTRAAALHQTDPSADEDAAPKPAVCP